MENQGKPLEILVVEDNQKNLDACKKALNELKGKEVVAVDIGYRSYLAPVGGKIVNPRDFNSKYIESVNKYLSEGKFPENYEEYGDKVRISKPVRIGNVKYVSNAGEALQSIGEADVVITDFFFKGKDDKIHEQYLDYVKAVEDSSLFEGEVRGPYRGDYSFAYKTLEETLDALRTGKTNEKALRERVEAGASFLKEALNNLPNVEPEFAYGGQIMLESEKQGKPSVLITSIHRHATKADSVATAINGVMALYPLIEKDIINASEAENDGGRRYVGQEVGGDKKDTPEGWNVALAKSISAYQERENGVGNLDLPKEKESSSDSGIKDVDAMIEKMLREK
jgi:hypothetical protein